MSATPSDPLRRPRTRADCVNGTRPCPFVSCEHHLYLDTSSITGNIGVNFPEISVADMSETCSLDVADRGGLTLEEVGAASNIARDRVRQIEMRGRLKIHGAHQEKSLEQTNSPNADLPASSDKRLVHVEIVGIGRRLSEQLAATPALMHHLTPGEFEEFVCDRLFSLGLEPQRVGPVNHKDGGIDIIFWPRSRTSFPFLGARK